MLTNVIKTGHADAGVRAYPMSELVTPEERARRDLAALEKEAYEKGFEAGEKAGTRTGLERMSVQQEKLARLTASLEGATGRLFADGISEMVSLAFTVAARIIRGEVLLREDAVVPVLKEAMGAVLDTERVVVRLSPRDMRFVQGEPGAAGEITAGRGPVSFEEDPGMEPGGCVVTARHMELDAAIETQLDQLYGKLLDGRGR